MKKHSLGLAVALCMLASSVALAPALACPVMPGANPNPPAVAGTNSTVSFASGSLIIPMDGCYARMGFLSNSELTDLFFDAFTAKECQTNSEKDDGIIPAYFVAFALVEAGIPVYWSVGSGKTGWNDYDFTITRAAGAPVHHYEPGGSIDTSRFSSITSMSYAGAPFIVDASNAAAAITLLDSLEGISDTSDIGEVDIHITQASFNAPIQTQIGALPRIAAIDINGITGFNNDKTGFLDSTVEDAMLDHMPTTVFEWVSHANVMADTLLTGTTLNYDLVWVPSFDFGSGALTVGQSNFIAKLSAYADAGGSILFQDDAIAAVEGDGSWSNPTYTASNTPAAGYMTNAGSYGVQTGSIGGTWDNGSATETTTSDDFSDPASQFGGMPWTGIGGSKKSWTPRCDSTYADGVRRMVSSLDLAATPTDSDYDMAIWRRKDNDANKGTIFYVGGYNWRKNTASGFRLVLNTVLVETTDVSALTVLEVGRSAPIVTLADKYVGTFESETLIASAPTFATLADAATFEFPAVSGHYRRLDLVALASSVVTRSTNDISYADLATDGVIAFDVADTLAMQTIDDSSAAGCTIDATCRHIFTNSGASGKTKTAISTANRATLITEGLAFSGATADYVIQRVHAGVDAGAGMFTARLGGVDRSTAAVIESSPVIGTLRPTIAYFGATDGMMHAVCADDVGVCAGNVGNELWAFMPRTELGKIGTNTTRIDGSPKVADVFGDFDSDGDSEYKTVLTFQTGNTGAAAIYALDITDPTDPAILWENTTTGTGTGLAMARVYIASMGSTHLTFAQYSDSTWGAGMKVVASETATGTLVWSWTTAYAAVREDGTGTLPLTAAIPSTSVPGGVSVFSSTAGNLADTVLVPTIWGSVYSLNAAGLDDGSNAHLAHNSGNPIFKFTSDYHPVGAPVSVYRSESDQSYHAIVVSGGFTDFDDMSPDTWSPPDAQQYAVGFPTTPTGTHTETTIKSGLDGGGSAGFYLELGLGNRAFAQAVVGGNEVFVVTDSGNVNATNYGVAGNTGLLHQKNLSDTATGALTVAATAINNGGGGLDINASTGMVYLGGGNTVQSMAAPGSTAAGSYQAAGNAVEATVANLAARYLWLRTW